MKTLKLYSLLLLSILFVFSSCSKDEDDPKPQTKTELLTAKTWKVSKITGDGIDITNSPDVAMIKNLRSKYNTDGTFTQTTSGDSYSGVWEFGNNETFLIHDPNTEDEENWSITELKNGSLKIRTTWIYEDEYGDIETMLIELEMIHA